MWKSYSISGVLFHHILHHIDAFSVVLKTAQHFANEGVFGRVLDWHFGRFSPLCQMNTWYASARSSTSSASRAGSGWWAPSVSSRCGSRSPPVFTTITANTKTAWRGTTGALHYTVDTGILFVSLTRKKTSPNFSVFFLSTGISECFRQKQLLDEVCSSACVFPFVHRLASCYLCVPWCRITAAWWIAPCGSSRYLIDYLSSTCVSNPLICVCAVQNIILCQTFAASPFI